jgi:hypothetical protein
MTAHHMRILTNAEQLAALEAMLVGAKPRRYRHPETGCGCAECDARDRVLESRAEDRAAEALREFEGLAGTWSG